MPTCSSIEIVGRRLHGSRIFFLIDSLVRLAALASSSIAGDHGVMARSLLTILFTAACMATDAADAPGKPNEKPASLTRRSSRARPLGSRDRAAASIDSFAAEKLNSGY